MVQYEPRIQKGDILYIVVNTANESSALLLNQPNFYGASSSAGASSSSSGNTITGYLVDDNGTIIFPLIGKLNVAGMTKAALTDTITNKVKQIAVDAIVSVRLLNYRVTVLGEVAKPGTYSIPSERVTILDAIGLAGDLTVFGKRNNIKIMRETDGKREMGTLDLNNGDIFSSPYYFLRQNDIVYVEMNSRKMQNADQTNVRNLSLGLGIISAVSLIITTITRF
ncbi:sugar transporter [Pseudoflavitalea sp. G-6-1-2]|uniref:polysaccharide biosynthesis/export family protein n=1 Tax=Pseudoflavitalea sp. G-6-1-2 TaxID=2728841 RepID=UPI00146C35A2|nr:sugar transporter [Pseudoflavitalea sp. G-6-1-2]